MYGIETMAYAISHVYNTGIRDQKLNFCKAGISANMWDGGNFGEKREIPTLKEGV